MLHGLLCISVFILIYVSRKWSIIEGKKDFVFHEMLRYCIILYCIICMPKYLNGEPKSAFH